MIPQVGARDPVDAVGVSIPLSHVLAERPDCNTIVPVRLFVVVLPGNVKEELLGSIALLDSIGEATDLFCQSDTVPEELPVSEITVFRLQQIHLVSELAEEFTVFLTDSIRIKGLFAQIVDFFSFLPWGHGPIENRYFIKRFQNLRLEPHPGHLRTVSTTG